MVRMMLDEHGLSFEIFYDIEKGEVWAPGRAGGGRLSDSRTSLIWFAR